MCSEPAGVAGAPLSGGHLIQGLYGTARTIDSTARQRESLVTLGTMAALPDAAVAPGLEWAASPFAVTSLLAEVKDSTGRISELVAAVRSYSQMDRGSVQEIDVTHGIDSTVVTLWYNQPNFEGARVDGDHPVPIHTPQYFAPDSAPAIVHPPRGACR